MAKAAIVVATAILALFASVAPAPAVAIFSSASGDGTGNTLACTINTLCTTGAVVNVDPTPTPPWIAPVTGGRQWVSYDNTGGTVSGPEQAAGLGVGQETVSFIYTIAADALPRILNLSIWADDTARVSLDGVALINPTLDPAGYPACSSIAIGCSAGTEGTLAGILLAAGASHTLTFDVFQMGNTGTPFGLSFEGDLAAVPEPATILLLGSALAAAGMASRRRLQKRGE